MTVEDMYTPGADAVDISPEKNGSLIKEIVQKGHGTQHPPKGAQVTVHYVGKLAVNGKQFDSSRDRHEPFKFKIGEGSVIKGWDIGVATMIPGEVCMLTIAAEKGYGSTGSPPSIPANATLVFEIELIHFEREDLTENKDGGVIREPIEEGSGYANPVDGSDLKIKMTGSAGGVVFDEERMIDFCLGDGEDHEVPKGVEVGLRRFKKGERSKLILSQKYALGGRKVPGDAESVEYDVELVSFVKAKEPWQMDMAEKFETARAAKEKGGKLFAATAFDRAVTAYERVVACLKDEPGEALPNDQSEERDNLLVAAQLNLALVHLKRKDPRSALKEADNVLQMKPTNVKGLFRRGQARLDMEDPDLAKRDFARVVEIEPTNSAAIQKIAVCNTLLKQQFAKDKKLYGNMFGRLASADAKKAEKAAKERDACFNDVGEWKDGEAASASATN